MDRSIERRARDEVGGVDGERARSMGMKLFVGFDSHARGRGRTVDGDWATNRWVVLRLGLWTRERSTDAEADADASFRRSFAAKRTMGKKMMWRMLAHGGALGGNSCR